MTFASQPPESESEAEEEAEAAAAPAPRAYNRPSQPSKKVQKKEEPSVVSPCLLLLCSITISYALIWPIIAVSA